MGYQSFYFKARTHWKSSKTRALIHFLLWLFNNDSCSKRGIIYQLAISFYRVVWMFSLVFTPRLDLESYGTFDFVVYSLNYLRFDTLFAESGVDLWFWLIWMLGTIIVPISYIVISQFYDKRLERYFVRLPLRAFKDVLGIPITYLSFVYIRYSVLPVNHEKLYITCESGQFVYPHGFASFVGAVLLL
jgi:hypothetical protein